MRDAPPPEPRLATEAEIIEALAAIGAERAAEHEAGLRTLLAKMARYGHGRDEPVRAVAALLGDRWSSLTMHLLHSGMLRHADLRRLMALVSAEREVSQRMLTLKLRLLERDGLIERSVVDGAPPRVEYRLTELGRGAYAHFAALVTWTESVTPRIRAARERYDHLHPGEAEDEGD